MAVTPVIDLRGNTVLADAFSPGVSVVASDVEDAIAAKSEVAALTDLAGTLTGSVDGTLADVANIAISTSGGNTYADSAVNTAVNTAIASVNLQLKELQTKVNAIIDALQA